MRKLYFITVFLCTCFFSFAAPVISLVNNGGNWRTSSTWNLNRVPQDGDTVLITSGSMVVVDNNWNISPANLFIKVYGTLKVAGSGSKLVIGSGSYVWVFDSGLVLGTGSPSEIIKIGSNTVFEGDEPPVQGPVVASVSTSGFDNLANSTLPVKFLGFSAAFRNKEVLVQWSTSEEFNALAYELERSENGSNWRTIATLKAAGNSNTTNNYSYNDKNSISKIVYYRIRQVDLDGKFTYTPVKSLHANDGVASNINIAAIDGKLVLQFQQEVKGDLVLRVVSTTGHVSEEKLFTNPAGQLVLNTKMKGISIISLSNGQDISLARQVIL